MKQIITFPNHLRSLRRGVDTIANAVKVTLGPNGSPVILEMKDGEYVITKDGVTVAKEITVTNPIENIGVQLTKQVANNVAKEAGDGTSTSIVLTQAIFNAGIKNVAAGANLIDLKRGMDKAVAKVVENLRGQSSPIKSSSEVAQVGAISANNDMEIGKMIADAMDKVGKDGVITVEEARGTETHVSFSEGLEFNQGYLSRHFITHKDDNNVQYDNARLLFCKQKIESVEKITPIVEQCITEEVPLIIIAQEVEGAALSTLVLNKVRRGFKLCAVKAPYFSEKREDTLEDMAVLTGGIVVDEDKGMRLDAVRLNDLGTCDKIIISRDNTIIIGGDGDEGEIEERSQEIRRAIDDAYSDYDREKLQERLAKLAGGVAILYIGAATEVEMKEKKDRVDDALHATRAAVQEGVVPGGGVALLNCYFSIKKELESNTFGMNEHELEGFNIILKAIRLPFKTILNNAGISEEIPNKVLEDNFNESNDLTLGYNVHTNELVNMLESGIIDPTKVSRLALENAASIASLLLLSKGTVTYLRANQFGAGVPKKSDEYLSIDDIV